MSSNAVLALHIIGIQIFFEWKQYLTIGFDVLKKRVFSWIIFSVFPMFKGLSLEIMSSPSLRYSNLDLVDHLVKNLEHPRVVTLDQGLVNFVVQIKSGLPLAIVNKILLEYSHVQLFRYYLWLLSCYIGASWVVVTEKA